MTVDVALWVGGIGLVPFIGALIYIITTLHTLLKMHLSPEKTGFGTIGLREVIERNTQVQKDLTHYIKWLGKQTTGQEPPPPITGN